ncbi:hypothetical protein HU200_028100 [Digitaria exilis]|uniref:Glycosyltransferase n=1 Tax=Digitaria exilis TaxID=1010633 RepID=A0A835BVC8_9POAL|nr:hypothetical protein HU200_028100 [Digitaria exilis]
MAMATPTIVLLPVWGAGHLMPMLEAGKRLLASSGGGHAFSVTVLVMPPPPTEQQASEVDGHIRRAEEEVAAAAGDLDVRFQRLPAVDPPTDHQGPVEFISRVVELHAPNVRAAISGLPPASPVAAVVLDLFCTPLIDVARDLAVPSTYVYFTCNAAALSFFLRLPALCDEVAGEFVDMDGGAAVDISGLPPVPPLSLLTPVMEKTKPECAWYSYHGRRFADADGIVVNTAAELEPGVLSAIAAGRCTHGNAPPRLYAIGPVISFPRRHRRRIHACGGWTRNHRRRAGFLTAAQAHEVAHGLERSGHRFLWVLRGPPAPGTRSPTDADLAGGELLPEGFLDAVTGDDNDDGGGGRGMVWPTTAPQKEILAHAAVGGFVTHCGWNSVMESLWCGVPMAPWPMYAEQHLNAFAMVGAMGVAVSMEVDRKKGNFVEAAELERAVREMMGGGDEGRKVREKAAAMKVACRNAVVDGGSSAAALRRLAGDIVSRCAMNGPNEVGALLSDD